MQKLKGNKSVWFSLILVLVAWFCMYLIIHNNKKIDIEEDMNNQDITQTLNNQDSQILNDQPENTTNNMEKVSNEDLSAKAGDVLTMNYTGRLVDGTVFDSNVDPKFGHVEPFKFVLGAGQVIAGWDEGLVGMKVGGKKTLTIPPEKGYGSRAVGPIPANSTLIFEVELVGIE